MKIGNKGGEKKIEKLIIVARHDVRDRERGGIGEVGKEKNKIIGVFPSSPMV
jgi:hypothetical protein